VDLFINRIFAIEFFAIEFFLSSFCYRVFVSSEDWHLDISLVWRYSVVLETGLPLWRLNVDKTHPNRLVSSSIYAKVVVSKSYCSIAIAYCHSSGSFHKSNFCDRVFCYRVLSIEFLLSSFCDRVFAIECLLLSVLLSVQSSYQSSFFVDKSQVAQSDRDWNFCSCTLSHVLLTSFVLCSCECPG
jgi:hypothetical protein